MRADTRARQKFVNDAVAKLDANQVHWLKMFLVVDSRPPDVVDAVADVLGLAGLLERDWMTGWGAVPVKLKPHVANALGFKKPARAAGQSRPAMSAQEIEALRRSAPSPARTPNGGAST